MGIQGLLKDLEKSRTGCFLEDLVGQRVAVDASDWIYKAICVPHDAFHAEQHLFGRLINLLLFKIKPILVFDGHELPAKKQVYEERKANKARMLTEAEKLMSEGKVKQAAHMRRMAGGGTGKLTEAMKKLCTTYKIPYVQSPLEADAQIAHLAKKNLVDFVTSNDSDMMVYACRKVLYKLANGKGELYEQNQIEQSWGTPYDEETFRAVAILTGSDYLKGGLPGFGIKSARKLYSKLSQPFDFQQMINSVTLLVPPDFEQKFVDAVNVFKYQLVFDVISKTVQPLTPYPKGKTAQDYPGAGDPSIVLGEYYDASGEQCSLPVWVVSQSSTRLQRLYFCTVCLKCFSSHQNRSVHMLTSHQDKRWFCNHCGKSFTGKSHLTVHIRSHTGEKPYDCSTCGKAFTTPNSLTVHIRSHTGEKPYDCSTCGKGFTTTSQLTDHTRSHAVDKSFACETCGETFAIKTTLTRHILIHTGVKPYVCDTCGIGFARKFDVKVHMRSHTGHKPYVCEFCGKTFTQTSALTRHVRVHTGDKPYCCETCGKRFTQKPHLTRHQRKHKPLAEFEQDSEPVPTTSGGSRGIWRSVMAFGVDGIGRTTGFTTSCVTRHVRIHTGDKSYACEKCGKTFTSKSHLTRHVRTHTGEKPYVCDICEKTFSLKHHLTAHQRKQHKPLPESEPVPTKSRESRGFWRSGLALGVDGSGRMTGSSIDVTSGATEPSEEPGKRGSCRKRSLSSASTSAGSQKSQSKNKYFSGEADSSHVQTPSRLQKQDLNNSKRESRSNGKKSCSSKAAAPEKQMQKPENDVKEETIDELKTRTGGGGKGNCVKNTRKSPRVMAMLARASASQELLDDNELVTEQHEFVKKLMSNTQVNETSEPNE